MLAVHHTLLVVWWCPTVLAAQCWPYSVGYTVLAIHCWPYSASLTRFAIQCWPYSVGRPYSVGHTVLAIQCWPYSAGHAVLVICSVGLRVRKHVQIVLAIQCWPYSAGHAVLAMQCWLVDSHACGNVTRHPWACVQTCAQARASTRA